MKCIHYELNNDMTVLMIPIKKTSIITVGFFIKAGSNNDEQHSGLAHFLEHMMFGGTYHRSRENIFNMLDSMGTNYNAVTTAQHTYYYISGHPDDIHKILNIVVDIYMNPTFDLSSIENERKVVIEEMRMVNDNPFIKINDKLHQKYFHDTPLHNNIIGTEQDILNINQSDLFNFRNKYYVPSNTVFVISGDFVPKQIFPPIEKILNTIPNNKLNDNNLDDNIIIDNMKLQQKPYISIEQNLTLCQSYVMLTFPIYDLFKNHEQELNIISSLLSSGFSSRLFTSLRIDNGITYTLSSYPMTYENAGVFIIRLIVHPNELLFSLHKIIDELKKIKYELIPKKEYKKINDMIKKESIFSSNQPIDWFTYFGLNFLYDRKFNPDLSNNEKITRVTSRKKIMEFSNIIFNFDKINLFLYGNIKDDNIISHINEYVNN